MPARTLRQGHQRQSRNFACIAVAVLAISASGIEWVIPVCVQLGRLAFAASCPACQTSSEGAIVPRRESLAAGLLSGLLPLASLVRAEELPKPASWGWQIKLPPGWTIVRQRGVPGPEETRTKELLLAEDPSQGVKLKVLRIPLLTTPQDPQGLGGLALIDFFGTQPRITKEQVLQVLTPAFARQPATFDFKLVGSGEESVKEKQKYFAYEFNLTRCDGAQVQGLNGKVCQRSDNGQPILTAAFHHAVLNAVTAEPGGGRLAASGAYPEVLWTVDVSVPVAQWPDLSKEVMQLLSTFAVGAIQDLEARRNATQTA
eukprot:TRINITY_DN58842_c0_g1_i1.p1 TRINITY_DN58842_c0_g1~~TRINITY_DN58842_c0_g1_i1.p1  ORF type:complete len:315 (-),score=51.72 TRINITY_DN58842_c0_g1_i1:533-1477(-)